MSDQPKHETQVSHIIDGDYSSFWAHCSCKWRDERGRTTWMEADEEASKHLDEPRTNQ